MRVDAPNGFGYHGHEELGTYFDGHTADAQSYFLRVDSPAAGSSVVVAAGRYVDRFERGVDGRWRIRARRCEVDNL